MAATPLPEGHFGICGGQGYGYDELVPGEVIRNPNREGPRYVVVVHASKQYYREDGLSFGVGADSGYLYSAEVRPATEAESAPRRQAEEAAKQFQAAQEQVCELAARFTQDGERPGCPQQVVEGERLLDTQTLYGCGDWWVIRPDAIWYVRNNGADGDNWEWNNVCTGGAGAIGWKMPHAKEPGNREPGRRGRRSMSAERGWSAESAATQHGESARRMRFRTADSPGARPHRSRRVSSPLDRRRPSGSP